MSTEGASSLASREDDHGDDGECVEVVERGLDSDINSQGRRDVLGQNDMREVDFEGFTQSNYEDTDEPDMSADEAAAIVAHMFD
eukprot:g70793.t1